jgi:hypothetical protein
MKSSEIIPKDRIPTGVRQTTIANPALDDWPGIVNYSGDPEQYNFSSVQKKNYDALKNILARNDISFDYIGSSTYPGWRAYDDYGWKERGLPESIKLTRFVAVSPKLVWEKYEGMTAGGGRNTVYVGGNSLKLTTFLKLQPEEQDRLINS